MLGCPSHAAFSAKGYVWGRWLELPGPRCMWACGRGLWEREPARNTDLSLALISHETSLGSTELSETDPG